MNFKTISAKLDRMGVIASTVCAIHCALLPLVIALLPMTGLNFLSYPIVEYGMIFTAAIIGLFSLGMSFMRIHKRVWPLLLFFAGLATISFSHAEFTGWAEGSLVASGGMLIVIAHFLNSRYVGSCSTAEALMHLKTNTVQHNEPA
jgi:hypothetical protein